MYMTPSGGLADVGMTPAELAALGYTLIVDPSTPLLAMHRALRRSYAALAQGQADPRMEGDSEAEQKRVHKTIGLDELLAIEARTVERGEGAGG